MSICVFTLLKQRSTSQLKTRLKEKAELVCGLPFCRYDTDDSLVKNIILKINWALILNIYVPQKQEVWELNLVVSVCLHLEDQPTQCGHQISFKDKMTEPATVAEHKGLTWDLTKWSVKWFRENRRRMIRLTAWGWGRGRLAAPLSHAHCWSLWAPPLLWCYVWQRKNLSSERQAKFSH